jgi:hypothetical protein
MMVPTLYVGTNHLTLRVKGRGASATRVPTQSVGTIINAQVPFAGPTVAGKRPV